MHRHVLAHLWQAGRPAATLDNYISKFVRCLGHARSLGGQYNEILMIIDTALNVMLDRKELRPYFEFIFLRMEGALVKVW